MAANVLITADFSEPLAGATTAVFDIDAGDGNLTIGRLGAGEQALANGELQYSRKEGPPARTLERSGGNAILRLRRVGAGRPWFRLPWAACNGASEWQIQVNPTVPGEITAHSDGGNLRLNLASTALTRLSADTGGGNIEVMLPEGAADLAVVAKTGAGNVSIEVGSGTRGSGTVNASSGAGNVVVRLPGGVAARIRATTGLGKATVDPRFARVDKDTYQSPGYDGAADRVEVTVHSGAGNVTVAAS